MQSKVFSYPLIIKETHLDTFGHVNNAVYLTLFEDARWQLLTENGFGLKEIMKVGQGPTILSVKMDYLKELRLRDSIVIETQLISYEKKIGKLVQKMIRGGEVCCTAEFVFGLFDVRERKLILPTPQWLKAMGVEP